LYLIQHFVIKFVSDNFLQVLWFPPPRKTDHYDTTEILLNFNIIIILLSNKHPYIFVTRKKNNVSKIFQLSWTNWALYIGMYYKQ
jgi:hypothetical protein